MYDLGILGKCIYSTCYSVVKSTSDGEKYIALHDSLVGCHVTMHTDVTDIEWMVSGIAPLPIIVVTTGIPVFSASSCISFLACAILTPPPQRNTGFFCHS